MELTRKDLLCKGVTVSTKEEITGWYCEGNVLEDGTYTRKRISFLIPVYPDLCKSNTGVTRLHGFIEVVPESVTLAVIDNE